MSEECKKAEQIENNELPEQDLDKVAGGKDSFNGSRSNIKNNIVDPVPATPPPPSTV